MMKQCKLCHRRSVDISQELGVCHACLRERPEKALPIAMLAHKKSRVAFGLPENPPRAPDGALCNRCVNECRIPEGVVGYCGLRMNENGRIKGASGVEGKLSWYHDPLPTNCVADWVCSGGTGAGYPEYAYSPGAEYGYRNLAVFFHACSYNCLFCQNWHFRHKSLKSGTEPVDELVAGVDGRTSCICFFGGDPSPQLEYALKASELAIRKNKNRILRICWETNGSMNKGLLDKMIKLSLQSGGCIKFDLKAWDESLHVALTGSTNRRTIENFKRVGEVVNKRKCPPLLVASTLLVPGYIDEEEVRCISRFIASVDPEIPYSLLAFYPHFYMSDLPLTPGELADNCYNVAQEAGLKNVRLGNVHLLE